MTREQRAGLHKKQERLQIEDGVPTSRDLQEGVPVLRSTAEGLVEYITHKNILYKRVLEKASKTEIIPVLGATGYAPLGGGLVLQWGLVTSDGIVGFPYHFRNACLSVVFGKVSSDGAIPRVTGFSRTAFTYSSVNVADGDTYWQAIGH